MSKNTIIAVLAVLVVGLGGYLVYDKVVNKDEKKEPEKVETSKVESNTQDETNSGTVEQPMEEKKVQVVNDKRGFLAALVDTEGNAYVYATGVKEENFDLTTLDALNSYYKTYNPKGYNGSLKAYKLNIANVQSVYYVYDGNDDEQGYFIFVSLDGTLSYFDQGKLLFGGEVIFKNISGLSNIVSIVQKGLTPYAVDKDGKEISLHDYLN